jgi:hypothetical protein
MIHLIRDVLDAQVVDRRGRKLGRVDGIILELPADRPPRVRGIQIGAAVAAARVHPALARWFTALAKRFGLFSDPVVVGVDHIKDTGVDVRLDLISSDRPRLLHIEKWAREHIVARLPGGGT